MDNLIGKTLTGFEFNKVCGTKKLYKFTNEKENHHGYQYKDGLNVDTISFNPSGACQAGGLYFATEDHYYSFAGYGSNLREVTIPDDARVYIEKGAMKANKIFLAKKIVWYKDLYHLKNIVKNIGIALFFIPEIARTGEICKLAVEQYGMALQYVPDLIKTEEMCLLAVQQNKNALQYVPNRFRPVVLWKIYV